MRYPGTVRCRILPPIEPGLDKETFLQRLIEATETACDEFLVQASQDKNPPPMPATAKARLAELKAQQSNTTETVAETTPKA
jgi:1-acyl-sn-glycerol-3-phosphate acyltransferase